MPRSRDEYFTITVVSIALFIFFHNFFFFYLLLVVAALPFISYFVSRYVWNRLEVTAAIPLYNVGENNDIPIEFTVHNPTFLPLPGVRIQFTADNRFYPNEEKQEMSLPIRKGTNKYTWNIKSVYSGYVGLHGGKMRAQDFMGLFVFKRDWECDAGVSVIPGRSEVIMNIIETTLTEGDEHDYDSGLSTENVSQVKEFRLYRPGDRMQRVNWKISARHDEIYVKEFELEYSRNLTLLVELRKDSDEVGFLNELITAFYSAACQLIDMEIRFSVQWFNSSLGAFQSQNVEESDGLNDVLQQLYMSDSYGGYLAYEHYKELPHGRNDMAIYFTSPSFSDYNPDNKLGTFRESVDLICLL